MSFWFWNVGCAFVLRVDLKKEETHKEAQNLENPVN